MPTARMRKRRRDLVIGVGCGLVATTALTLFLISDRSDLAKMPEPSSVQNVPIRLAVTPPWARVAIDGHDAGKPDETGKLKVMLPMEGAAMRWLEVSAEGFHSVRRPLSVFGGMQDVSIELIQKPYDVAIRTEPPGAEVWINNELRGQSPLTVTLSPGEKARLAVRRPGYLPVERDIIQNPRNAKMDVDLALVAAARVVAVESTPPGATVRVGNRVRGITPFQMTLDAAEAQGELNLLASLPGYEDAATILKIPSEPAAEVGPVQLALQPKQSQILIDTDPPGGRVVIEGNDHGAAPVTLSYPSHRVGETVVAEAALGATHAGRQAIVIPPPGSTQRVTIATKFTGQRVVFVLLPAAIAGPDHVILVRQLSDQIHQLSGDQQFAVLACSDDGVRSFPEDADVLAASSEQKVRAYDMVRSIRPAQHLSMEPALRRAASLQPSVLWLFTGTEVDRDDLEKFASAMNNPQLSVHIVTTTAGRHDDWLSSWSTRHRGTFTLLGRDKPPTVAMDAAANN